MLICLLDYWHSFHFTLQHLKIGKKKKTGVPHYLVDKADGWSLAAVQEVNVYDLQLLQSDVEGLELAVVSVQGNHFEQAVIQPQADHTTLWVDDADDTSF